MSLHHPGQLDRNAAVGDGGPAPERRPRKTLNFDTPAERFHQAVALLKLQPISVGCALSGRPSPEFGDEPFFCPLFGRS